MKSDFKERTWSLVSVKPLFFYSRHFDTYFVMWHGQLMTREEAIYLIISYKNGIVPGMKVKMANVENYLQLYRIGLLEQYTDYLGLGWSIPNLRSALNTPDFQKRVVLAQERSKYLQNNMHPMLREHFLNTPLQEMLSWFHYDKAMSDD